jgi:sec-independent protein translocase protein TatA
VPVEERLAARPGQAIEDVETPSFAHVHDALDHRAPAGVGGVTDRMPWGTLLVVNLGTTELLIILAIILLIFGGAKLPKLARSLGQAQKEFKDGVAEGEESAGSDPAQPAPHKSEGNGIA